MNKKSSQSSSGDSYPNSTIIEALCELHFTSGGNASDEVWDGKWFGRLLTELGQKYDMEPKLMSRVQVQSSGDQTKISSQAIPAMAHMIYRCKNGSYLIQLSPWKLTINELKYENWDTFSKHIQHAWISLSKIIDAIGLKRIGMRYINKIPRATAEESVGSWINDTRLVPNSLLEQKKNFFYRNELQKSDDTKLILVIAEETSTSPPSLIFDIDIISLKELNGDWNFISAEIDNIHKQIREVFDSSCTEKYTKFLNNFS